MKVFSALNLLLNSHLRLSKLRFCGLRKPFRKP